MKKKILLTVLVLVVAVALLVGCSAKSDNTVDTDAELLSNGNFELNVPDTGWTVSKTGESGSVTFPYFSADAQGYDAERGHRYAVITAESGKTTFTRVSQTVSIEPHRTYRLSVDYRITTTVAAGDGAKGFYLTLDGFKYFYRAATVETDGWQTWKLYFNSDNYDEVTVVLGLGEADYIAQAGVVNFDNVSLVCLDDTAAADVVAQSLSQANTLGGKYDSNYRMSGVDVVFTVLIVVLTAGLLVAAYFALRRLSVKKDVEIAPNGMVKGSSILKNTTFLLIVTLVVGFAMRLVLSLTLFGYGAYENAVMSNTTAMLENKLWGYYFNYETYYAPGVMYLLYVMGAIAAPLKLTAGTQGMAIFLKIPALIADLLLIAIVFLAVDKRKGSVWALVIGLTMALLPVLYAASALWGVYTSIAALFLVLTFMAVRKKQVIKMTVFYFLAVLFAEEALILLPLLVVYAIMLYVKYPETRMRLPIAATVAFVVGYAVTVPLALDYYVAGHPFIVLERYVTVFNQNDYFARNIFNLYAMVGVGANSVNTAGVVMGAIFAAASMLGGIAMYLKNRNRQDLLMYAAWTLIAVYTTSVRMNLWVLMLGAVLLLTYVAYTDEKRLAWCFGAFAVTSAVNACYVMAVGGNVKGGVGAAGVTVASLDPVAIVFSALTLVTFFALTYVVADVCLGRKKPFMPLVRSKRDRNKEKGNVADQQ